MHDGLVRYAFEFDREGVVSGLERGARLALGECPGLLERQPGEKSQRQQVRDSTSSRGMYARHDKSTTSRCTRCFSKPPRSRTSLERPKTCHRSRSHSSPT